jgi:hypothetical protein
MPIPNNGLITETNRQYYEGAQGFQVVNENTSGIGPPQPTTSFTTTFNTDLIFGSDDPNDPDYALNNFKLYISSTGLPGSFTEVLGSSGIPTVEYNVIGNTIYNVNPVYWGIGTYVVVQLKTLDGGNYGNPLTPGSYAYGNTVEENYGGYSYLTLNDVINNFMVAYVGDGKLISAVKRTDVIFHAKRSMQEFSYDTLKSIKSMELNIPPSLSIVLPQDYVNYVKVSWIDQSGVKHPMYPTNNLTISPYENPIQDTRGVPIQDNFGDNIDGTSITEERWKSNGMYVSNDTTQALNNYNYNYDNITGYGPFGERYGLDPQYANINGYFNINDREGKMSFSSGLVDRLIVLEYISDGLAYNLDTRVPKMAEEAMYAHILHAILSLRSGQPEYIVNRLKQEKNAKLRNAKIRLSNIKLEEITQVMRGKSKWIKH